MLKFYTFILSLLLVSLIASPINGQDLQWHSFEQALAKANSNAKYILVDVGAPWCGWCHKMKRDVYPALASLLDKHFILTHLNRDDRENKHQYKGQTFTSIRLAQKLKAESAPAVVLLSPDGNYLLHIDGFTNAENLRPVLKYISANAYQRESFKTFRNRIESKSD